MRRSTCRAALLAAVAALVAGAGVFPAAAQFGQNKITEGRYDWKVYASPHFDVHHYNLTQDQLASLVSELESAYLDLSKRLDHELRNRIPVIFYTTRRDFQRTNTYATEAEVPEGVAAFAEPFRNRLVMPIDTPPDRRYAVLRHELVHIFQFDIFYAGSLKRILRLQEAGGAPLWLFEGMASYLADDEDSIAQMVIRDAVVSNVIPSIRNMSQYGYLTYRYGHALMEFIEATYGPQGFRNFIFEYRKVLLSPDPGKAFEDAFGLTVEQLDRRYARYLRQRYLPVLTDTRSPEDYGREIGVRREGTQTISPALSPSGELIAAVANPGLELDVVIVSARDGKIIRNLTGGLTNRYRYVVVEAFEGQRDLAWSPDGDRLAFFVQGDNYRELYVYDVRSGDRVRRVEFKEVTSNASPSFSPDGRSIAFAGNRGGQWDIFSYDLETKEIENLTQDEYYDGNPTWSPDGKTILYNRRIGQFAKVFTVAVGTPERKVQLTAGAASDIMPTFSRDSAYVYFSSDRGRFGIFNLHRLELASGKIERLTDIAGGAFTPEPMAPADDGTPRIAYATFLQQSFRVFGMRVGGPEVERAIKVGEAEPQTSPRAPSRREAYKAELRARGLAADPAGDGEGVDSARPAPAPPPAPAPLREPAAGGAADGRTGSAGPSAVNGAAAQEGEGDDTAEEEGGDADLRPFRPPLDLGVDPGRTQPYRTKWDFDVTPVTVGVTDDGTFLANFAVRFADLLNDQQAIFTAYSVSSYENFDLTYTNYKSRIDWGASAQYYSDYYVYGSDRIEEAQNYSAVSAFASYPLSRLYRVEGNLGYARRSVNYAFPDPQTGQVFFDEFTDSYPFAGVAFVADTVRWQSFGPYQGHRARLGVNYYALSADSAESVGGLSTPADDGVVQYLFDWRGYQRVTARSLLAARIQYIRQDGTRSSVYSMGGINQLRGFEYREFFGQNLALVNLEFRFPMFEGLVFPGGRSGIGPFRGFLFADAGSAWFEDFPHLVCPATAISFLDCDPTPVRGRAVYDRDLGVYRQYDARDGDFLRDVHAAGGIGFHVPILGLPFTWTFAKVWDGEDLQKWHSSFYIVYDW